MMRVTKEMRTVSQRPFWKRTLAFRQDEEAGPKAYGTAPGPWSALSLFHYKVTALGAAGASHFGKWTTFIPIHIQMLFRDGTMHQLLQQRGDTVTREGDRRLTETSVTAVTAVNRTEAVISREGDVRHTHHSPFIMQRQDTARQWLIQLLSQQQMERFSGRTIQAEARSGPAETIRPFMERIRERDAFTLKLLEQVVDRPLFVEQFVREIGLYPVESPGISASTAVLRSRDPLMMTHYTMQEDGEQEERLATSQVRYQDTLSRLFMKSFNRLQYRMQEANTRERQIVRQLIRLSETAHGRGDAGVPAVSRRVQGGENAGKTDRVSFEAQPALPPLSDTQPILESDTAKQERRNEFARQPLKTTREEQLYRMQLLHRLEQDDRLIMMPLRERLLQRLTEVRHTAWTPRVLQYMRSRERVSDEQTETPSPGRPVDVRRESTGMIRLVHRQETAVSIVDQLSTELGRFKKNRQLTERILTKDASSKEWIRSITDVRASHQEGPVRDTRVFQTGATERVHEQLRAGPGVFLLKRQAVHQDVEERLIRHERMNERLFERDMHAAFLTQDEWKSRALFIRSLERIQERFAFTDPAVSREDEPLPFESRRTVLQGASLKHVIATSADTDPVLPAWKTRIDAVYRLLKSEVRQRGTSGAGSRPAATEQSEQEPAVTRLSAQEVSLNRLRPHPMIMNAFYTNRMQLAKLFLSMHRLRPETKDPASPVETRAPRIPAWKERFTALTRWQTIRQTAAGSASGDTDRITAAPTRGPSLSLTHLHETVDRQDGESVSARMQKLLRVWVRQAVIKERLKPARERTTRRYSEMNTHTWIKEIERSFRETVGPPGLTVQGDAGRPDPVQTVTRQLLHWTKERLAEVTRQADPGAVIASRQAHWITALIREADTSPSRETPTGSQRTAFRQDHTLVHAKETDHLSHEEIRTSVRTYLQSVQAKLTERIRERETALSSTVIERDGQSPAGASRVRHLIERANRSTENERHTASLRTRTESMRSRSSFVHKETAAGKDQETVRAERRREVQTVRSHIRDLKETVRETRTVLERGGATAVPGSGPIRLPMLHRQRLSTIHEQLQVLMGAKGAASAPYKAATRASESGGYASDVASRADIRFLKQPGRETEANSEARLRQVLSPRMDFRKQAPPEAPEPKKQKTTDEQVRIQTQVFESDYLKTQRERVQMETIVEKVFQEIERRNHFQRQRSGW